MSGWIFSLITFPGVIVHEIAHLLMCRVAGVRVIKVCYFRFGNPAGYVVHEAPRRAAYGILIGVGPFLVNSVLGGLVAARVTVPTVSFIPASVPDFVLVWLGLAIALHAFPSRQDAKAIWQSLWSPGANILERLVGVPIVGLIYLGALGSYLRLDILYGLAVALLAPGLVEKFFGA